MKKNKKTAAVFLSAGLGDALLLVPLVKKLKSDGYLVTAIVTSAYDCESLFEKSGLFEKQVILRSKTYQSFYALRNRKSFDLALVNYFAASKANLLLAGAIGKRVYCNNTANKSALLGKNITFKQTIPAIHDAEQNLLLYDEKFIPGQLKTSDFLISAENVKNEGHIAIQVSAGNNKAPYKTWPAKSWIAFIEKLLDTYSKLNIVLLGDKNEVAFEDELQLKNERLTSLIGKTSIAQAMEVIAASSLFVGLDGGLMHMAVALGKPTFTIWGGSDPVLYGYDKMDPAKHRSIRKAMNCAPCNSWIAPNTSKTTDPVKCPDFACLAGLNTETVFKEFRTFYESLNTHAA